MMLSVKNLTTSYAGIKALRGVTLSVNEGEMVALVGSNGAGKSSLLNSLSGVVATSGSVVFGGEEIVRLSPSKIARMGLLHVPEGRQIIADLTVLENLQLGNLALGRRSARYTFNDIYDLFPILLERQKQLAGSLSGGQQQMLAIGRALMGSPRLLLLDEPSLGLAPLVVSQVFDAISRLNRDGLTVFLVEQNARRALESTDRAYVLEHGRIVIEGRSADLLNDSRIADHYLGRVVTEHA
jgi:branched-chain amino acid transport system ATP-binding protein